MSDCREPHGCDTPALRAVWIPAQLTGRNLGLQVGGDRGSGLREDAVFRRSGRISELEDLRVVHVELRITAPQTTQFGDTGGALR